MSEHPTIWTAIVRDGKLEELETHIGTFRLQPSVDFAALDRQRLRDYAVDFVKYVEAARRVGINADMILRTERLVTTHATVVETTIAPQPEAAPLVPVVASSQVSYEEPSILEDFQPKKNGRFDFLLKKEKAAQERTVESRLTVTTGADDEWYTVPDAIYQKSASRRYVPRSVVDRTYRQLRDRPMSWNSVSTFLSGEPKSTVSSLLASWRHLGIVEQSDGKGSDYEVAVITLRIKEFAKRRGNVTVDDVRQAFWIPADVAQSEIDELTQENYLRKHATRDEWAFNAERGAVTAKAAAIATPKTFSTSPALVLSPKISDPKEYNKAFFSSICDECHHHYQCFFVRRDHKVCGGCYKKIGGVTHGSDRTYANATTGI
jgi:hypothetical protein